MQTDQLYIEGKKWYQSKTFWTSIIDVITSIGAICMGETTFAIASQAIYLPLLLLWIRLGMNKKITWK